MPLPLPSLVLLLMMMLAACEQRAQLASCSDDLHGLWIAPSGERWAMIDRGKTLEGFAMFDDAASGAAPRVIDLELARGDTLTGEVRRRYTSGGDHCEARAPIRVATCGAHALQVVVADPLPPLGFAPCTWGQTAPSRVERWRRD